MILITKMPIHIEPNKSASSIDIYNIKPLTFLTRLYEYVLIIMHNPPWR